METAKTTCPWPRAVRHLDRAETEKHTVELTGETIRPNRPVRHPNVFERRGYLGAKWLRLPRFVRADARNSVVSVCRTLECSPNEV
jgi:hypothetical protein